MKRLFQFVVFILLSNINLNAQVTFSDEASALGIEHFCQLKLDMGAGVAVFDFNNDDFPDVYFTGGELVDGLFKNNGDGTFDNVSISSGINVLDTFGTQGVITGDIDNDGFREIFVTTVSDHRNILLKNNGDGTFTDITVAAGVAGLEEWATSASFGDFDKDGFIDLYVGNYVEVGNGAVDSTGMITFYHECYPNTLYKNNGDGTFSDMSNFFSIIDSGCTLSTTFTDYDNDNDVDILTANDFGNFVIANVALNNQYPNQFEDVSAASGFNAQMFGMGIGIGDMDRDLDLDYYVTNIGRNVLELNNGDGTFTDIATSAGVENTWEFQDSLHSTSWGTGFLDVDNNGWLDLFVANGYVSADSLLLLAKYNEDKLFYNNGDNTFDDITVSSNLANGNINRGFAMADLNKDGLIDIIPASTSDDDTLSIASTIMINTTVNNNNWIAVDLEGQYSNRDAYGSKMIIYSSEGSWLHEVSGGASHMSQHSTTAHFGIGQATVVDSLVITWTNGWVQTKKNLAVNQFYHFVEDSTIIDDTTSITHNAFTFNLYPNPVNDILKIYIDSEDKLKEARIYNALGQLVLSKRDLINGRTDLDVSGFTPGSYFIELNVAQNIVRRSFFKQ